MIAIDRIDDAILTALQNNARMSNKELAAAVEPLVELLEVGKVRFEA